MILYVERLMVKVSLEKNWLGKAYLKNNAGGREFGMVPLQKLFL